MDFNKDWFSSFPKENGRGNGRANGRGNQQDNRGRRFSRRGRRGQNCSSRSSSASRSVCDDISDNEDLTETDPNQGVVGVFWDIENCPVPRNVSARTVAKKIRDEFYQGRREELFVAACDVKNQGVKVSKQLNESQVTVMHVDSSMKNAADQTLKVHLARFAEVAKKAKGSSVVLVSGDCDFAPQIHDLRYRYGVHVVLLHAPKVRDELLDVANQALPFREFLSGAIQPAQVLVENLPTHRVEEEMQSMLKILCKNDLARIGCVEKNGRCVITFPNEAAAKMSVEAVNGVNLFGNVLAAKLLKGSQGQKKKSSAQVEVNLLKGSQGQKKKSSTQVEVVLEHLPKMKKHQLVQELNNIIAEFSGKIGRFLNNTCTLYFADKSCANAAMEKLQDWQHGKNAVTLRDSLEPMTSRAAAEPQILKRRSLIVKRVKRNKVCAVVADCGYGKSTYVPYFLSSDLPADGTIICTQTFKLAAVRHALNVSRLMNCRIGTGVAFEIDNTPPVVGKPKVVYTTDYCMLEKCVLNPDLNGVSCIIVDEIQDRTMFADILLGFLYRLIKKRTDLRIVLLSSDVQSAKSVFTLFGLGDKENLLDFSGSSFGVEVSWQDLEEANSVDKAVAMAFNICSDVTPGNILVFLATQSDTHRACEIFKKKVNSDHIEVLAFHSRLSPKEQNKLFSHSDRRKVIFTDAIAENAVSIAGVRFVVDSGWKRDCRTAFPSRISKASANCRRSRAINGICCRLYTHATYQRMKNVCKPEVLTCGLSHVCLKLTQLGVDNPCLFDFPDPPPKEALFSDLKTLVSLGAIESNRLSQLGTFMSSLPLDPHLAKMVVKGAVQYEAIVIAAMTSLSSSGVQFFTGGTCALAENNDFVTFFRVFDEWSKVLNEKKNEWCGQHKVNNKAMKMANDFIGDLLFILKKKMRTVTRPKDETFREETRLLVCLLIFEIFAENICVSLGHPSEGYASANPARRQDRLFLHPSSFLTETPAVVLYDKSVRAKDKDLMLHVMPVSEELLTCAFDKGLVKPDCFERVKGQMLATVTFGPYGQRVMKMFAGNDGDRRRKVESNLRALLDSRPLSISFSSKDGLVTAECSAKDKQKVRDHLTSDLQDIISQLEAEKAPIGHSSNFEYGCGAQVLPTSDPIQYERVRVVAVPNTTMSAAVLNDLRAFGSIVHYTEEEEDGVKELIVTFSNTGEARDAVSKIAASRPYRVIPETATFVSRFEAEVTWMRRPCTGSARLFFAAVEDLVWAGEHLCRATFLQKISFSVNKTTYADILMEGLPWDASSQLVHETLSKILAENDFGRRDLTPERVEVTRDPGYVSTPEECASKKISLQSLFSVFVQRGEMDVQVLQPESTQLHWKCLLSFTNSADRKDVVEKIQLGIAFPGSDVLLKVKSECTQRCTLGIHHKKVVRLLRAELDKLVAPRGYSLELRPLNDPNTMVRLELKAAGEGDVLPDVRQQACDLLKGEVLTGGQFDQIRALKSLKPHLRIMLDEFKEEVRVYGTETQRNETKTTIEKSLHSKSLPLPRGVLKVAMSTYGNDLDSLRQVCGLHFVRLRLFPDAGHQLDVCGPLAALVEVEAVIGHLSSQDAIADLLCSVCSCPLDADSAYRLQVCGHPYCISCIPLLVKNSPIPLACLAQNCGKLLVLEDFRQEEVRERALRSFVRSHLDEYRFCPLPYCNAIYRPNEFHRKRNCKGCTNDFCLQCDEIYLEGHSCRRLVSEAKKSSSSSSEDVTKCHSCGFPLVESDHCLDSIRFCLICDAPC